MQDSGHDRCFTVASDSKSTSSAAGSVAVFSSPDFAYFLRSWPFGCGKLRPATSLPVYLLKAGELWKKGLSSCG